MIERKIIIGMIVSTEYLRQIEGIWDVRFLESGAARRLARWILEFFEKYGKAPKQEIETIFYDKLRTGKISEDIAEEIEQDILPGLSEQYVEDDLNLDHLIDQTKKYFNERNLVIRNLSIQAALDKGDLLEAEKIASEYKPVVVSGAEDIDLSDENVLVKIDKAFNKDIEPLIRYPGPLGEFWNDQLIRGGFVALLASEKRGKTWWMLDMSNRACDKGKKVAFFQAGDMTESQQLRRICIYRTMKSDQERYAGKMHQPVLDCIHNQVNECTREDRVCDFGVFDGFSIKDIKGMTLYDLKEAYKSNPDYKPCHACEEFKKKPWGAPWIKEVDVGPPLTASEAKHSIEKFFIKHKVNFKISTHPNDTLSIDMIESILDIWERQKDFVPDVIIVDYADLLVADKSENYRQSQNKIWKGLRRLSQTRGNPLVITATQADAASYDKDSLRMNNFSEDKRKYGHVTAMWGLNQDSKDREKIIGVMRINEIVKREGEFFHTREVKVLQNLKRGRPFLGSYW